MRLLKLPSLLLLLGIASGLAGCDNDAAPDENDHPVVPDDFVRHDNPQRGISLRTPPGWVEEATGNDALRLTGPAEGDYRPVLLIQTCAAVGDVSASETRQTLAKSLETRLPQFHLESQTGSTTIDGAPAMRLAYTAQLTDQSPTMQWEQFIARKHDRVWIFTFSALPTQWKQLDRLANEMIASAQLQ